MFEVPVENVTFVQIEGWRKSDGKVLFEGEEMNDYPSDIVIQGTMFHLDEIEDDYEDEDGSGNVYELVFYSKTL